MNAGIVQPGVNTIKNTGRVFAGGRTMTAILCQKY